MSLPHRSRRRRAAVAVLPVVALAACASADGTERGALRESLVEPGITALDRADSAACSADARALETALGTYELLEGEPAPDEAALVAAGYLRSESALWDVVAGALVAQDPGCGNAPVATIDIVTDDAALPDDELARLERELAGLTPKAFLADLPAEQIAEVGGTECALEVAEVGLALARWSVEHGAEPDSLQQLVDEGDLATLELWVPTAGALDPRPGSGCEGPVDLIGP